MLDRTQEQIMQSWKRKGPCLVSVVCATYNHEPYIREAIESFLMQETDFPFEIIIHDDASTDDTAKIIRKYHELYPDIIKPIFQQENQYSKGKFKPSVYAAGFSKSEFIALCEGDDYWIGSQKLQIQVEAMEEHPEIDFSFHSAYRLRDGIRDAKPSWDYGYDQTLYPDSILESVGSFAPTVSYILRREVLDNMPGWFYETAPVGDFFFEMYGAKRGGALYLNEPMAVHIVNAQYSWSSVMKKDYMARLESLDKMLASLQLLKEDFPEFLCSFGKKESVLYWRMSKCNLRARNNYLFTKSIERSVHKYAYFSSRQRLAYIFRKSPNLLWILAKFEFVFPFFQRNRN